MQAQPAFELLLASGLVALTNVRFRLKSPQFRSNLAPYFTTLLILLPLTLLLFTNVFALSNYFSEPSYAKSPPWHLYHDYVQGKAQPRDVMLTNFPEASVSYYSPDGLPFYVVPAERDLPALARLRDTEQIANAYERIWFLPFQRQGFDEQLDVLNWLDRHADRVDQIFFQNYNLNLYLSPTVIDTLLIDQSVRFSHGIDLRGYQILDKKGRSRLVPPDETTPAPLLHLVAGDEFTLSLYWQTAAPTDVAYTVFTHFTTADGFVVTSQDNQPVWGSYPTTAWNPDEQIVDRYTLTLPNETGPGDYRLRLGWYNPDTQARVPVLDASDQPVTDQVTLDAIVTVEQGE